MPDSRNDFAVYGSDGRVTGRATLWESRQGRVEVVSETVNLTHTCPSEYLGNFIAELQDFHAAIEEVIIRRGSSRRFRRESISYRQLSTMLDRATRGVGADFLEEPGAAQSPEDVPTLNQLYLIVNDVDGLPAGSYVFHRDRGALEQLQAGEMRETAGRLDLGQELAADAGVNVYFLTDLNAVLERYGNRGYRMAQMEASTMGGRLYLGAYAQRLGATGLTFFDDEVTEFFSPHAEGKSVMFLVAVGRTARRRRTA